jgi:hypothetical protein
VRLGLLLLLAACGGREIFPCTAASQCVLGELTGRCEPQGYCSFPAPMCPSGFRFGEFAPEELADVCVGESPALSQ